MQIVKESLDNFLEHNDMRVAVIKGKWGIGKTYFWNSYIEDYIESPKCNQIAYSYISLFGKSNLNDIKQSIFYTAKQIQSKDNSSKAGTKLFNHKAPIISSVKKLSKLLKDTPYINGYSSAISALENSMVHDYIICIDDIERKSKYLSIKEVMALVDELAQRKSCKVVLVFNEESLDEEEDKKEFEIYREKVVDIELTYNPTHDDQLICVIGSNPPYYKKLSELVKYFNIKNIRIIRKIKWILDELWQFVEDEPRLVDDLLTHITLFCWSYYKSYDALPFELINIYFYKNLPIYNQLPTQIRYLIPRNTEDKDTTKLLSIVEELSIDSEIYDQQIIDFLRYGYLDKDKFQSKIEEIYENTEVYRVQEDINKNCWNIYQKSFKDNLEEFKKNFQSIMNSDVDKIDIYEFSSIINILQKSGDDITGYIDDYIKEHKDTLQSSIDISSPDMDRIKSPQLLNRINDICNESEILSIDEITKKIVINKDPWKPQYTEYLSSLNSDNYFDWMRSNPDDLSQKIHILYSQKEDITNKVIEALKKIADTNKFNRERVKNLYRVDIEDEDRGLQD